MLRVGLEPEMICLLVPSFRFAKTRQDIGFGLMNYWEKAWTILKYSCILGGHKITRDQSPEDLVIFREILQQLQTDISKLKYVSHRRWCHSRWGRETKSDRSQTCTYRHSKLCQSLGENKRNKVWKWISHVISPIACDRFKNSHLYHSKYILIVFPSGGEGVWQIPPFSRCKIRKS